MGMKEEEGEAREEGFVLVQREQWTEIKQTLQKARELLAKL